MIKEIINGMNLIIILIVIEKGLAITLKKYLYIPMSINKAEPLIPGINLPAAYNPPAINIVR